MVVQLLVVVRGNVAARKSFLKMRGELRVNGHHVFKVAVLVAVLDHQDFAVAFDDLRLDLTDFIVEQDFVR